MGDARGRQMEMQQIRYFLALCEKQNFTQAAKRCGVSQPSLTNGIRRLEKELGGSLFHRSKGGIKLSPLGTAVQPYLYQIDRSAREARSQATKFSAIGLVSATAPRQGKTSNTTDVRTLSTIDVKALPRYGILSEADE
jgi:DNA-binding transcriptional LysR family regulator